VAITPWGTQLSSFFDVQRRVALLLVRLVDWFETNRSLGNEFLTDNPLGMPSLPVELR